MSEQYLDEADGALLLRVARESLEDYLRRGERKNTADYEASPRLREPHGAFVTLRQRADGALRGCIGQTRAVQPLIDTVSEFAVIAATRDPRFPPVRADELPGLHIEVSALAPGDEPGSPFRKVHDLSEIELGEDGLYLAPVDRPGGGLLLPQVPGEQGWNLEQFLHGLCRKANAPEGAWNNPAYSLYRFRAQVFEEA
ncbi:MAG: AmmeMemoRadiSam system protein A [Candidatus Hydrogenedens sp.]|nr:AmmeMemoRadiSam system protein A [Candidatus Hydrogenedens sp.]